MSGGESRLDHLGGLEHVRGMRPADGKVPEPPATDQPIVVPKETPPAPAAAPPAEPPSRAMGLWEWTMAARRRQQVNPHVEPNDQAEQLQLPADLAAIVASAGLTVTEAVPVYLRTDFTPKVRAAS
jgi:hypothetical protein